MINVLQNLAEVRAKNAIFSPIFLRNIFKIITSVPVHPDRIFRFSWILKAMDSDWTMKWQQKYELIKLKKYFTTRSGWDRVHILQIYIYYYRGL
jgi:ribosomal protein L11 methylase PrmA